MKTHKIKRELVTRAEAAERLGVTVRTFDRWRKQYDIQEVRYGAPSMYWVKFDWDEIKDLREEHG